MLTEKLGRFFSLGFVSSSETPDVPLMLGKKTNSRGKRMIWEIVCWLLMSCGIFLRKALAVTDLVWARDNLTAGAFAAALVVALAAFPMFMRWFNRRHHRLSFEHFASAFAFGFCLDLAAFAADKIVPHMLSAEVHHAQSIL